MAMYLSLLLRLIQLDDYNKVIMNTQNQKTKNVTVSVADFDKMLVDICGKFEALQVTVSDASQDGLL